MSGFDSALGGYRPPAAGDIEVSFPRSTQRRREEPAPPAEPSAEPDRDEPGDELEPDIDEPEVGEFGGGSDSGADTASTVEDLVERDEPDDGEHTDSTEEQIAARAAKTPEVDGSEEATPHPPAPQVSPTPPEPQAATAQVLDDEEPARTRAPKREATKRSLSDFEGIRPVVMEKVGFNVGDADMITIKRFPVTLVDRLRMSIAPIVGGEFAEQLSAQALLTAFLMAKTGVELEADANTSVAADVFRQSDPRLLSVEDRINEVLGGLEELQNRTTTVLRRTRETGDIVDGLENSVAFLVGDRVTRLSTHDVDEHSVDVTQKKVLTVRERIRSSTREQRQLEKDQHGRELHRSGVTSEGV